MNATGDHVLISDLSVRYSGAEQAAIQELSLRIPRGQFVLLAGPSGSGKSTLLNVMNGTLSASVGLEVQGDIQIDGDAMLEQSVRWPKVACVFQNPERQLCSATPARELTFVLENLGVPKADREGKIRDTLPLVGLAPHRDQDVHTLSGGEQQRLALACAWIAEPSVLLLDEPFSQLDPMAIVTFRSLLEALRKVRPVSVILAEHRLHDSLDLADRVLLMDGGRVVLDVEQEAFLDDLKPAQALGLTVPTLPAMFAQLGRSERPLTAAAAPSLDLALTAPEPTAAAGPAMTLTGVRYAFGRKEQHDLGPLELTFNRGERVAIMGGNGAGKSTLLSLLAGLLQANEGHLNWSLPEHTVGLLMQSPDLMLIGETVDEELRFGPSQLGLASEEQDCRVESAVCGFDLRSQLGSGPLALSQGQRARVALASVMTMQPQVLLLDEPTTGQNQRQAERMLAAVTAANPELLLFCTHDIEFAARHAKRLILMAAGQIVADGPIDTVLRDDTALREASLTSTPFIDYAHRLGHCCYDPERIVAAVREERL